MHAHPQRPVTALAPQEFPARPRRQRRSRYDAVPKRWYRLRRVVTMAALVATALAGLWVVRTTVAITSFGKVSLGDLLGILTGHGSSTTGDALAAHDRVNIALFGYGGDGHSGAYLTDSMMVVSIQQQAGHAVQVAELSIPRDWWVPIDLGGGRTHHARINEAFSDGQTGGPSASSEFPAPGNGGPMADATLERLLGIHIDHYIGMDFEAFKAMVDAVGGVDVDVPHTFTDHQYPAGECGPGGNCGYMTVHFDAGMQHMDGQTALEFARSRHADEAIEASDFARSHRQQLILAAIRQKALSLGGISRLPDLLSAISGHVVTDMNLADESAVYNLVKTVDPSHIEHVSLDDTNYLEDCGYPVSCDTWVLFARDRTYQSVQHFVQNLLPDPDALGEHATVTVLDGAGEGGAASARWASILNSMGFHAVDGGVTAPSSATQVTEVAAAAKTAAWLGDYFGSPPTLAPVPTGGGPATAAVTLVIGSEEEAAFNNHSGDPLHD